MNRYEQKQEARRERLERAAERARSDGAAAFKRSDDYVAGIPPGQPILVGHHSERRHRRAIEKSMEAAHRGLKLQAKAADLEHAAGRVGSGGISADDPEAIDKLKEKIADLESERSKMKDANNAYRYAKKQNWLGALENVPALREKYNLGEKLAAKVLLYEPSWSGDKGPFSGWPLQNLGANIRRYQQRLADIEKRDAAREAEAPRMVERAGVRAEEDREDNRVRLYFPGKPGPKTRGYMKSRGWRWAPSVGAWQRQLNQHAMDYAEEAIKVYEQECY